MPVSRSDLKTLNRVLIKAGTSVITHSDGSVALSRVSFIVEAISRLLKRGVQVILVSSGAVGIGKQKLGHHLNKEYEKDSILMRSFAATGQGNLMAIYDYMFSYYKVKCAQVLLTDNDFLYDQRRNNLRETLNRLLEYSVVPILNENDVISLRKTPYRDNEYKIVWDNDSLACLVGIELKMDLVILLTDVNGLYKDIKKFKSKNESSNHNKYDSGISYEATENEIIDIYMPNMSENDGSFTIGEKSRVGRGGMKAKIDNALNAISNGIKAVVIANGKKQDTIDKIVNGENIGTLFINHESLEDSSYDSQNIVNPTNNTNTTGHIYDDSEKGNTRQQNVSNTNGNNNSNGDAFDIDKYKLTTRTVGLNENDTDTKEDMTNKDKDSKTMIYHNPCTNSEMKTEDMSVFFDAKQIARDARNESRKLVCLDGKTRSLILQNISNVLSNKTVQNEIFEANKIDMKMAEMNKEKWNLTNQLINRLKLTQNKLDTIIDGINQLVNKDDPLNKTIYSIELSDKLKLDKIYTSMGVLLIIFESRPDVLPQVISLAIKSGNGIILKGGKEAKNTNKILYDIITKSINDTCKNMANVINGEKLIYLIESRENVMKLLKTLDKSDIDLIIPRGSNQLVKAIENNTNIPVLGHSEGLCHAYIDKYANLNKAMLIVKDSKCNYPAACNSIETLLIHSQFGINNITKIINLLKNECNVDIYYGAKLLQFLKENNIINNTSNLKMVNNFSTEYSDLCISIELVCDINEAINHINKYGSGHTDTIITENNVNAKLFINSIDSSCVFHNVSTRFNDGYRFGLGAEVGISTNRIHARGPVGIEGLLTTKFILVSNDENGDIVEDYSNGKKKFTHKMLNVESKL